MFHVGKVCGKTVVLLSVFCMGLLSARAGMFVSASNVPLAVRWSRIAKRPFIGRFAPDFRLPRAELVSQSPTHTSSVEGRLGNKGETEIRGKRK